MKRALFSILACLSIAAPVMAKPTSTAETVRIIDLSDCHLYSDEGSGIVEEMGCQLPSGELISVKNPQLLIGGLAMGKPSQWKYEQVKYYFGLFGQTLQEHLVKNWRKP